MILPLPPSRQRLRSRLSNKRLSILDLVRQVPFGRPDRSIASLARPRSIFSCTVIDPSEPPRMPAPRRTLPLEIQLKIIGSAVEETGIWLVEDGRPWQIARWRILTACALVCQAWKDEAQKLLYKDISFDFDEHARPSDGIKHLGAFLQGLLDLDDVDPRVETIRLGMSVIQTNLAIQACPLLPRLRHLSGLLRQTGALGVPVPARLDTRPAIRSLRVVDESADPPSLSPWLDHSRLRTVDLFLDSVEDVPDVLRLAPEDLERVDLGSWDDLGPILIFCQRFKHLKTLWVITLHDQSIELPLPAVPLLSWPRLEVLGLNHPDVAPFLAAGHPTLRELCFFGSAPSPDIASQAFEVNVLQLAANVASVCEIVRTDPRRLPSLRTVSLSLDSGLYVGAPPGWDTVRRTTGFAAMAQMVQGVGLRFGFVFAGADGREWEETWPKQRWAQLPKGPA